MDTIEHPTAEPLLVIEDTATGAVVTGKLVRGTAFRRIGGVTAERKERHSKQLHT